MKNKILTGLGILILVTLVLIHEFFKLVKRIFKRLFIYRLTMKTCQRRRA